ncbi:MAG TPA: SDR family oxidoreductase [Alphaproteobacteria bacterium]|nr:SDR family oxidoreductase [Alphaproteobacteria bacterium]
MSGRALVTGGSAGIGRAVVERLATDGYDCIVFDRVAPEGDLPGRWFEVDLSDRLDTASALEQALSSGPITRLVNNVGVVRPGSLEAASAADFEAAVSLNLRCALQCTQALVPGMKGERFGRIVNISSRAALGKELRSVYSATKAGLHGFVKTWALELGAFGITANAIGPGPIRTALFEAANPPDSPRTRAIIEGVPVKRMGQPADIAHAVSFFLDARSGFVTGQVLYVCGGMTVGAVT